ncbi:nucleotide-diphospho-sugar transferase [Peziza echinospora]|nr:nucleotide-diphospho-sugar transferase [Peziza echinospora]
MRTLGRLTVVVPTITFLGLCILLVAAFQNSRFQGSIQDSPQSWINNTYSHIPIPPPRQRRFAIASSVQTASYIPYALQLAYTIQKHNDLDTQDAEMVILVRMGGDDGVSEVDIERLEKVGWKVRVIEDLEFEKVDIGEIRARHRHNMNKLYLWSWTEYERILFVDADVICKGGFGEVWGMPGDFAAAPDVWPKVLTDNKFNSGVVLLRPNMEEYRNLIKKVSDPTFHSPEDADQAFLNVYYQFRYFGLPYKYNLNLVMYQYHRKAWDALWDEAVFVHFTTKKPTPDTRYQCGPGCEEYEPTRYYTKIFKEMLEMYGFQEEIPVHA